MTNHGSSYIPREWQKRIRTLPSLSTRTMLALFLISAYKRRKVINPILPEWKTDQHLGALAFWPAHTRKQLFILHMEFMRTDRRYRELMSRPVKQINRNMICAGQNSNTPPYNLGA